MPYNNNNNNLYIYNNIKTVVKIYYILDVITRIIFYYVVRTKIVAKHVCDIRLYSPCKSLYLTRSAPNEQSYRDNSDAMKHIHQEEVMSYDICKIILIQLVISPTHLPSILSKYSSVAPPLSPSLSLSCFHSQ